MVENWLRAREIVRVGGGFGGKQVPRLRARMTERLGVADAENGPAQFASLDPSASLRAGFRGGCSGVSCGDLLPRAGYVGGGVASLGYEETRVGPGIS
jgi:hypothetical protein